MTNSRGRPRHPDVLTPAEWQVLEQIRAGQTNAEIAVELDISVNTVRYHVSNILGKLELGNRRAARNWSGDRRRWGWVAVGAFGFGKVATLSAALVTSAVLISGAISATGQEAGPAAPAAVPESTAAREVPDEPVEHPDRGRASDSPLTEGEQRTAVSGQPPRTALPLTRPAPTSALCDRVSTEDEIARAFGTPQTYATIANVPAGLVATGAPQWVDVDGCIVHRPWPDVAALFEALDLPMADLPETLTGHCLLAEPLVPPGTRIEAIPPRPGAAMDQPGYRLVASSGLPLDEPITVIAHCTLTGTGVRMTLSGAR